MIRFLLIATVLWLTGQPAIAQDFCRDARHVLVAAQSEFDGLTGTELPSSPGEGLTVYEASYGIATFGPCIIARQVVNGARFSTSYTCANAGVDTDAGLTALRAQVQQCLDVVQWNAQPNGALSAQWGLIRLSITRNGNRGGLALGVEVFRDERGQVMGSPTRGDRIMDTGDRRCVAKTPEEIAGYLEMYGSRPGAERFETSDFIGYTNRESRPVVAFATRPNHPAHPAVIVRDVYERDGQSYVTAGGDSAGDCEAFHALLRQVQQMNQNIGR
jgi:hypothetical protein